MSQTLFPSGSVSADNCTPLLASTTSPASRPRRLSSSTWAVKSWTAKLTTVEPACSASVNTCTHAPGTTCHSTRLGIGLLSAALPNSFSYQWQLFFTSVTGTTARTCSIDISTLSTALSWTDLPVGLNSSRAGRRRPRAAGWTSLPDTKPWVRQPTELQPGVLGGRGEECLQVVTPLRGRGLVRLDAGVVAAIEQQGSRLDFRYLGQRLHRAEHHEVIAAVVHRGHRAVDVGQRPVDDRRTEFRRRPVNPGEFIRFLRAEAGAAVRL